jgi:hypothetical protein
MENCVFQPKINNYYFNNHNNNNDNNNKNNNNMINRLYNDAIEKKKKLNEEIKKKYLPSFQPEFNPKSKILSEKRHQGYLNIKNKHNSSNSITKINKNINEND